MKIKHVDWNYVLVLLKKIQGTGNPANKKREIEIHNEVMEIAVFEYVHLDLTSMSGKGSCILDHYQIILKNKIYLEKELNKFDYDHSFQFCLIMSE